VHGEVEAGDLALGDQPLQGGGDVTGLYAGVGLGDAGDVDARLAVDGTQHLELDLVADAHAATLDPVAERKNPQVRKDPGVLSW
jgi:hypothetical protein